MLFAGIGCFWTGFGWRIGTKSRDLKYCFWTGICWNWTGITQWRHMVKRAGVSWSWLELNWNFQKIDATWNTAFELEFAGIGLELYSKSRDCAGVGCFWLELNWNIFKKMSQFELLVLNCFLLEFDWNWTGICWNSTGIELVFAGTWVCDF